MARRSERFKGCWELAAFRPGERLTQEAWEAAGFTPEEKRRELFRRAVQAQKEREQLERAASVNGNGVAVHDDRDWGHKGIYSPCLGLRVMSRTHQKELEKRLNVTCTN